MSVIPAMVDSAMAVSTRGVIRNLVDSIAVDQQLKQVEIICCPLTKETLQRNLNVLDHW